MAEIEIGTIHQLLIWCLWLDRSSDFGFDSLISWANDRQRVPIYASSNLAHQILTSRKAKKIRFHFPQLMSGTSIKMMAAGKTAQIKCFIP